MANSNRITAEQLAAAINGELTVYRQEVQDRVNRAGRKAIKELERITRDTAPFNVRAYHQHYMDLIASKSETSRTGDETHTWYVKPPGHRLTHLLVNGHETRDGGRTQADPFLRNAIDAVLPDYEEAIEKAVKP